MESIIQFGIAFSLWVQGLGWLELPMRGFTFLGSEEFFLFVLPIVYWCVDAGLGLRMGVILLFNGALNGVLKLAFFGPRPYWVNPQIKALTAETSFGVPSGHAQVAAGLWGMAASQVGRFWAWAAAVFLVLMIGFSRLYLGVHFLHDVLLGWLLGALTLWATLKLWQRAAAWLKTKSLGQQVGLAFLLSALLLVAGALAFGAARKMPLPAEWAANARAAGAEELPAPVTLNGVISPAATVFGLLAGLAWIQMHGGFSAGGTLKQRLLRFLVGLLGIAVLWYGLGAIFPRQEEIISYALRYLRYTLVGVWISAGAPWLFGRLKL
ncbi:MAG: phosphatase PAP2 family protein [Anaerolineales bacterium]|nr:phosphatase PAP2 family protein [Anaerolineales bacterium]MCX7755293.1 phosphatase PAP2 family protein [Anaerolineales bacterium]MDW8278461.1 phosphatase PAP2 family protein [Anaerolineales bacterium]